VKRDETKRPAGVLFLFDIDGTLLRRAGPHHRQALERALHRVTGLRATTDGIAVAGMLDRDILRAMLEAAGAPRPGADATIQAAVGPAERLYRATCPDLHARVCPGVRGVLRALRRRGVPLGLVTGNLSRIGWRKMERAGLRGYFQLGAFSEQGWTRADLGRRAAREARRRGLVRDGARVVLVGDHPNDIAAARANGFTSVAVATGLVSLEELRSHAPDVAVEDLRALELEALLCNA
jgi:phosphoglycolate phosphatase-like HAD superfamily hydrolase